MAFPTSPNNGDKYIKGSITYVYTSSNNSWTATNEVIVGDEILLMSGADRTIGTDYIYGRRLGESQFYLITRGYNNSFDSNYNIQSDNNLAGLIAQSLGGTLKTSYLSKGTIYSPMRYTGTSLSISSGNSYVDSQLIAIELN